MKTWFKIPIKDRIDLLKLYRLQGYSYKDAINDFENVVVKLSNGGTVPKPNNDYFVKDNTSVQNYKNPEFEIELMQKKLLKNKLYTEAQQGNVESDRRFREIFNTSPHRYRYDNDPEYKNYYDNLIKNSTERIQYPDDSPFRKGAIPANMRWMYPQLTDETAKSMGDFSNEIISSALPIPVVEQVGKIPSIFKTGKNLIKGGAKADNVIKLVEREKVFDDATLDLMDRFNRHYAGEKNVPLTLHEKIKIGRDVAANRDLNKAYRNTHFDEIIQAKKQGYFNNNRYPDTDWYYGGSASKYGDVMVEAVPDNRYFRLFKNDEGKYAGINTGDPNILHLKGTNVPFEGTKIWYKGKELTEKQIEKLSKVYKKGDNLEELLINI